MESVIVAFEREKTGERVRDVIESSGVASCLLCRSAAEVKRLVYEQRIGVVICGHKLPDESAELLFSDLPSTCSMLVIAMKSLLDLISEEDIHKLPAPASRGELTSAVQELVRASARAERFVRPLRGREERELVTKAKAYLETRRGMTEEQAHRFLQKISMDHGLKLHEAAKWVLDTSK